jgi:hypothetical protein
MKIQRSLWATTIHFQSFFFACHKTSLTFRIATRDNLPNDDQS